MRSHEMTALRLMTDSTATGGDECRGQASAKATQIFLEITQPV